MPMDTQDSANASIFKTVDCEDFKCSQCQKYLSVPPISNYTNPKTEKQNMSTCGRCKVPEDGRSIRNELFESLAKYLQFPCSISKDCPYKMAWGQAEKHEAECKYRKRPCTSCQSAGKDYEYIVADLKNHFVEYHQQEYFLNKSLIITVGVCCKTYAPAYLVEMGKTLCLVHLKVCEWELRIKIEPMSTWIPPSFNISFSKKNNMVLFKNNLIRNNSDWKEHQFDIKKIREFLMPENSNEFITNLDIIDEDGETEEQPKICKSSESALKEQLTKDLECSTCLKVMTSNIFVCTNGHSSCRMCETLTGTCSACRVWKGKIRNLALEQVVRTLFDYDIV